jgi:hypothetical protein
MCGEFANVSQDMDIDTASETTSITLSNQMDVVASRSPALKRTRRSTTVHSIIVRPAANVIAKSCPLTQWRREIDVEADEDLAQQSSDTMEVVSSASSAAHSRVGVLVHGCHLQADGWEEIVWGFPPERLGRLPQAVLLGFEEKADVIVFGTGASVAADGRLEGQYTLDTLLERLPRLHEFQALRRFPLVALQDFVRRVAIAELQSQNTIQEVRAAFDIFRERNLGRAFLVSSPTHLPRCLACACQAVAEDEREGQPTFNGEIHASPSETCYKGFQAADVVVVEPPHRGDRDKDLDSLPFHDMVRRSFKIPGQQRASFLKEFEGLLASYGV